jgi:uncharacterized membrane protein
MIIDVERDGVYDKDCNFIFCVFIILEIWAKTGKQ